MTLGHRINRTRNDAHSNALVKSYYRYRGLVIRSLNEDLNVEHKRTGDAVITGVITLLLAEAQQSTSTTWRCHLDGVKRLIDLRGGIHALAGLQNLDPLLRCFLSLAVFGNTTAPASDLATTDLHLDELDFILEQYGGRLTPFQMCPPALFAEIIKINHLRMRATTLASTGAQNLSQEAYAALGRVHDFSPEGWVESKPSSKGDWLLLGKVYQAAVAIYCISSLQSLSVLPPTSSLKARCATHGHLLQALVNEAMSSPRIKGFMLWPLALLGTEAVRGGAAMRAFVTRHLTDLSHHVGMSSPLTAKGVLERFWASGEAHWDACFDRPYLLVTQIAVDVSRIVPPC